MRALIIVPVRNAGRAIRHLVDSVLQQSTACDLSIVDSSSTDDAVAFLGMYKNIHLHTVKAEDFNHGGTRQMMVDIAPGYDVYIFLTQDAYLDGSCSIENIIRPFSDKDVGAVCGRQLPHKDATRIAAHARLFNYPPVSMVKSYEDSAILGLKTPFMSNSFAAYRREALVEVGGFPPHVILSEDMYVAAKMLMSGWKVAYQSEACVRHSHNYTLKQELLRYFDIGVFHAREAWIREKFGQAGGEGLRYVVSELKFLGLRHIYLWPSSLIRNFFKILGYKLGLKEKFIPLRLKRILSMHKRYWDGPFA